MDYTLINQINGKILAQELGLKFIGDDIEIKNISAFSDIQPFSLCFIKKLPEFNINIKALVITSEYDKKNKDLSLIKSQNPRLDFARALIFLDTNPGFCLLNQETYIDPSAKVSASSIIGKGVYIGKNTFIGNNVVIADGVKIGDDCHIKSNAVIGEAGFGFERDSQGIPTRILHFGGVTIGNRVEIGSLNTVCRGTLTNTIIEDDVKTDDHVHIAHNCIIKRGALITASVELSGGVEVGEFSWIGPNTSVIQKATLGSHSFVGIGANVTKSVEAYTTVAGNPAKVIRQKEI